MNNSAETVRQIPLPFENFKRFDFASYYAGDNGQALQHLQQIAEGEEHKNLYLWGQSGTGKSHLLQAVCTVLSTNGKNTAYLPLSRFKEITPELLEGLEQLDLICIDDLDRISGEEDWEQAIFNLFNGLRENKRPMIMAAQYSPQGIKIKLPDLKSRLAWDLIYHLVPLSENSVITALKHKARLRMFDMPDDVIEYLVKRVSRDSHSLFGLLDKLDEASLVSKKKLTIPFVKELLDL